MSPEVNLLNLLEVISYKKKKIEFSLISVEHNIFQGVQINKKIKNYHK